MVRDHGALHLQPQRGCQLLVLGMLHNEVLRPELGISKQAGL